MNILHKLTTEFLCFRVLKIRFKHNLYKNALPNGYCLHHPKQGACPHANVCLTCPKFTTSKAFIPVLSQQLKSLK